MTEKHSFNGYTIDQNFIRIKDVTLILTVLGLLGTIWKFSGLTELKAILDIHTTQIAVMQSQFSDIKQDLDEIKRGTRAIKSNTADIKENTSR
jgi:hypothetical protein